ncbi:MAG: hypothetical protein A3F17_00695 [Gammaproteobacteria bacterium RIFCSPHIGHO2_12_FULL_41_15]|nr:MAG: hypothetical protein A3F17_00695 [Gammaproteobacteria bacterium RIFCSPHIGHO2_12_FULL_41_15]
MTINVQHLAKLAKLALSEKQAEQLQAELNHLAPMIEQIKTVNTDVEPLANPLEQKQIFRTDKVTEKNEREALSQSAPTYKDGYYLVPQVIES